MVCVHRHSHYDGGLTWTTINATPNDPVQNMTGIWQQGGGNQDRNLLDFNEITVDDKGRVLYGYSDGCTSGPCIAGTAPELTTPPTCAWRGSSAASHYFHSLTASNPRPRSPRACRALALQRVLI
mgnify:CR=1 FL=1